MATPAETDSSVQNALEDLHAAALRYGSAKATEFGSTELTREERKEALRHLREAARDYHRTVMLAAALKLSGG